MSKRRIHLLGGLQVFSGPDRATAIPARKAQALLAYLARHPGRPHSRGRLASLLWESHDEVQARASLRQALAILRKALRLTANELVAEAGDTILLAPGCIISDVADFEERAERGTPDDLEQAVALYQGEFLEAFNPKAPAFEDWLMAERQRLRERAIDVMSGLLAYHLETGANERAIEVALRLLALDPLLESVHRTLMRLYARQGRIGAALRQFQICRDMLQQELGIGAEPETKRLFRDIQKQRRAPKPEAPEKHPPAIVEENGPEAPPQTASNTSTPETPSAELRQVTALCVEIEGADGEEDPERMQVQSDGLLKTTCAVVENYGGTIDRDLGGNVVALFGVPVAHSDDAERALRAAIDIRDSVEAPGHEVDRPTGVQIGIADGRMLVTWTGRSAGRIFTVTGDAVRRAATLSRAARKGEVLVSEATFAQLSHLANGARPREIPHRGPGKPLRARQIKALRVLPASARPVFVGRRAELSQFSGMLDACLETARGLTAYLRGEAGIGKTRLAEEFRRLAADRGFACHVGLVLDFGAGKGQSAIQAIVRGLLDIPPETQTIDQGAIEKAADGLVDKNPLVHLHDLLQLSPPRELRALYDAMDNATRDRGRREALVELIVNASARKPRLIVVEDVHWATPQVLALVQAMAAAAEKCPTLVVVTARPEGDPLSSSWGGAIAGGGPLIAMHLGPLHREDVTALAGEIADASDPFAMSCIERCGGNPLFLEQLLHGTPATAEGLPGSVQSVVLARMDRLNGTDRRALRAASIFGQLIPIAGLRHLLGDPAYECAGLLAHGLLRPTGGDYLFTHALVQEGVYASLPKAERRALHRRAAEWLGDRDATLSAEHLDRAEDPAAPRAYLEAARQQIADYRYEQALRLVERGLAFGGENTEDRFALACCRGDILHDLGSIDDARKAYEEALALARDDGERCRAWLGLAAVKRITDDFDGALADVKKAEEAAERLKLTEQAARAHFLHGNLLFPLADIDGCLREHRRSLELARQAGSAEREAAALGGLADAEYLRGRMLSAHEHARRCVKIAEQHGLGRIAVANRTMVCAALWYTGEMESALREALAMIDQAARVGHRRAEMLSQSGAFVCCHLLMDHDAARKHVEAALATARQIGATRFEAMSLARRADHLRALGRHEEALADLDAALTIGRETGMAFVGPWILGILATTTEDPKVRNEALEEAEKLLADNSISHNHLNFRKDAIEACLAGEDWTGVQHHAAALEEFCREEPLPWSSFFAARGRALAAFGRGERGADLVAELGRLKDEGERFGYRIALPAIDKALQLYGEP